MKLIYLYFLFKIIRFNIEGRNISFIKKKDLINDLSKN